MYLRSVIILSCFNALGVGIIIFVLYFMKVRKVNSQYKLDEKGTIHIQMMTKESGKEKYKKLSTEDGEGDDSSDSTVTDEHKKMLN